MQRYHFFSQTDMMQLLGSEYLPIRNTNVDTSTKQKENTDIILCLLKQKFN